MIAAVQGHHQTASYQNRDEASRTASPPERSPDYIDHAFACVNRSPIVGQAGRVESISYPSGVSKQLYQNFGIVF